MDKAEKKKEQLAHNEEIVFLGASRNKEEKRSPKKNFKQEALKHSYLWLYEEED